MAQTYRRPAAAWHGKYNRHSRHGMGVQQYSPVKREGESRRFEMTTKVIGRKQHQVDRIKS